jgi:hypothetical protein
MAKGLVGTSKLVSVSKKTSQGYKNVKRASMNKSKKRSFKKYRGQGK